MYITYVQWALICQKPMRVHARVYVDGFNIASETKAHGNKKRRRTKPQFIHLDMCVHVEHVRVCMCVCVCSNVLVHTSSVLGIFINAYVRVGGGGGGARARLCVCVYVCVCVCVRARALARAHSIARLL